MKIWVVVAKIEELQVFDSKEKEEKYSEEQDKEETRHFVNIGRIDRSVEEWEIE